MIVTIKTISVLMIGAIIWRIKFKNGFIRVKEEGWAGVSTGWQGCSKRISLVQSQRIILRSSPALSSDYPNFQSVTRRTALWQPLAAADCKTKIINPWAVLANSNIGNIAGTFLKINVLLDFNCLSSFTWKLWTLSKALDPPSHYFGQSKVEKIFQQ